MDQVKRVKENLLNMLEKTGNAKAEYTPQEVINIKEAAEAVYKIEICEAMCEAEKEGNYSGMYGTTPYYHDMNDMDMMYGRRSRDSMGRYTGHMYGTGSGNGSGMYGHSIKDRMVDNLERMMDSASSDYERQEIKAEIERIRNER